ncbi:MAG: vitamin B12 dependent-methionine synthase activation domain-containing protein, partial [Lachnospiraceae bacterium]|nr:vitamin B12 dependent-methionine synthase activation domain-containing protein [Lachnospiraceae bacterium]
EHTAAFCGLAVQSRALADNLRGCTHVVMMAATIGFGPELLSRKSTVTGRVTRALIADAAGSALIESWCDEVNDSIRHEASALGLFARPRFSPGYGDFPLEFQREIFNVLEVQKRIGITLSEQLLMLPAKSVTALIGLSPMNSRCPTAGCESCSRSDTCAYRR